MKLCPSCQETYPDDVDRCRQDGQWLIDPQASHDPADGYLGQVLQERYRIASKLGAGSVGAVFLAEDLIDGGQVAIKILMPSTGYNEPRAERRLKREAKAASGLDHPNIVRVLEYAEADGVPYLIMEFVQGDELGDLLIREPILHHRRAVHIVDQLCSSLSHAHGRGIVHRDLKPENIILTRRDGRPDFVKVLDFGLVKLIDVEGGIEPTRITDQNLVLGTPHYMSPEQITGARIGPAADLYSVGVLLYRMTVGQVPFPSDNVITVLQAHVKEAPAPPSQVVPGYPEPLQRLVMDLLVKDPRGRPATAEAVRQRLADPELQGSLGTWEEPSARVPSASYPASPAPPAASEDSAKTPAPRRLSSMFSGRPLLAYRADPGGEAPPLFWWMVGAAWMVAGLTLISMFVILGR